MLFRSQENGNQDPVNPNPPDTTPTVPSGDVIKVVDAQPPVITDINSANYTYGDTIQELHVIANVEDKGTLSYQWYISDAANVNGVAIDGATKESYVPNKNEIGTKYYYCIVTNTNNTVNGKKTATTISKVATITIKKAKGILTVDKKSILKSNEDKDFRSEERRVGKEC